MYLVEIDATLVQLAQACFCGFENVIVTQVAARHLRGNEDFIAYAFHSLTDNIFGAVHFGSVDEKRAKFDSTP